MTDDELASRASSMSRDQLIAGYVGAVLDGQRMVAKLKECAVMFDDTELAAEISALIEKVGSK